MRIFEFIITPLKFCSLDRGCDKRFEEKKKVFYNKEKFFGGK